MVGKSVAEIEDSVEKLRIVALKRNDDPIRMIPRADTRVNAGDLIVAMGDRAGLEALVKAQ
jgi:Trk K+ transport system NAD-binding subunit